MNKLKELIKVLKNLHTNDPAMHSRLVKVLDQMMYVMEHEMAWMVSDDSREEQ